MTDAEAYAVVKKMPTNKFVEDILDKYKNNKMTSNTTAWLHKLAMDARNKK